MWTTACSQAGIRQRLWTHSKPGSTECRGLAGLVRIGNLSWRCGRGDGGGCATIFTCAAAVTITTRCNGSRRRQQRQRRRRRRRRRRLQRVLLLLLLLLRPQLQQLSQQRSRLPTGQQFCLRRHCRRLQRVLLLLLLLHPPLALRAQPQRWPPPQQMPSPLQLYPSPHLQARLQPPGCTPRIAHTCCCPLVWPEEV